MRSARAINQSPVPPIALNKTLLNCPYCHGIAGIYQMRKGTIGFVIFLLIIFIGFGDKFLPKPLSTASANTRATINNFLANMMPERERKTDPYGRTEEAIEEVEGSQQEE